MSDETSEREPGFEEHMRGLDEVVTRLERGDQSLESALADFEAGMAMATKAQAILDGAEARVDQLLEERDGTTREVPFGETPRQG